MGAFKNLLKSYVKLVDVGGLTDRDQLVNSIKDNFLNSFEESPSYYVLKLKDRTNDNWSEIPCQVFDYKEQSTNVILDDYHRIYFQDFDQKVNLGDIFEFDNYRYMVINTDNIKSILQGCVIQRCNVQLKFYASNDKVVGATPTSPLYIIDGIMTNKIADPEGKTLVMLPDVQAFCKIPNDPASRLITSNSSKGGTRFLLGNPYQAWTCIAMDTIGDVRPTVEATPNDMNGTINLKLSNSKAQINKSMDNLELGIAKQDCYS